MDKYNCRAQELLEFKAKILRMSVAVAGGVVVLVLDVGRDDVEPVERSGRGGRERRGPRREPSTLL